MKYLLLAVLLVGCDTYYCIDGDFYKTFRKHELKRMDISDKYECVKRPTK